MKNEKIETTVDWLIEFCENKISECETRENDAKAWLDEDIKKLNEAIANEDLAEITYNAKGVAYASDKLADARRELTSYKQGLCYAKTERERLLSENK